MIDASTTATTSTQAPTRNTTSMASEKPTRIGCLIASGSFDNPLVSLMFTFPAAAPETPAACRLCAMLLAAFENRIDRKIAVPSRTADLAEERHRRRGDAHVTRIDRVLHGQHDRLHVHAEPGTEHDHAQVGLPQRGVGADARSATADPTTSSTEPTTGKTL